MLLDLAHDRLDAIRGDERVDRQFVVGRLQQFRLDGLPSGALHVFGVHEQVKGRVAVQGRAVLEEQLADGHAMGRGRRRCDQERGLARMILGIDQERRKLSE